VGGIQAKIRAVSALPNGGESGADGPIVSMVDNATITDQ
jgi:hypothetical protein